MSTQVQSLLSSQSQYRDSPLSDDPNNMSSVPFDRYDEEFAELTAQVRRSLSALQSSSSSSDLESGGGSSSAESDLRMASNLLGQCDDLLKQMGMEARGVDDASAKRDLLAKVRECKSSLTDLKSDYESEVTKFERSSLGLGSGSSGGAGGSGLSSEHRERLLKTNDQLASQNSTLENARRIMSDTEETALEITQELGRNREKIESAHGRVRDVSGLTNRARRIVQSMSRREVQQKLAMYAVSGILILLLIIIVVNARK